MSSFLLHALQYMRDSSGGWPAEALDQRPLRSRDLGCAGFATQLQRGFHRLVDAGCPARVATRFQAAQGGDRDVAS